MVRELVEEGLLALVVATNRIYIAFHLGEQLPASLVIFSIGHSLSIFAGIMSLKLQGNNMRYQCMVSELIILYTGETFQNTFVYAIGRFTKRYIANYWKPCTQLFF